MAGATYCATPYSVKEEMSGAVLYEQVQNKLEIYYSEELIMDFRNPRQVRERGVMPVPIRGLSE